MLIRRARVDDAPAISDMIMRMAHLLTTQPNGAGAEVFLNTIQPEAIAGYITSEDFEYFVGTVNDEMVSVVALRKPNHLFHLFVASPYHGKGFSTVLWKFMMHHVMSQSDVKQITVNASAYSIPIYEHFGFKPTGDVVDTNSIAYQPMVFNITLTGVTANIIEGYSS